MGVPVTCVFERESLANETFATDLLKQAEWDRNPIAYEYGKRADDPTLIAVLDWRGERSALPKGSTPIMFRTEAISGQRFNEAEARAFKAFQDAEDGQFGAWRYRVTVDGKVVRRNLVRSHVVAFLAPTAADHIPLSSVVITTTVRGRNVVITREPHERDQGLDL